MAARHWTDDDLLNRLYGIGEPDEAHLSACPDCAARLSAWQARRDSAIPHPEVSWDDLAAQRRAIYRRLGERRSPFVRWIPAFAATSAVLIGFVLFKPDTKVEAPLVAGDNSVFAEVYSMEQSSEPAAAETIQALFEEN